MNLKALVLRSIFRMLLDSITSHVTSQNRLLSEESTTFTMFDKVSELLQNV